MPGQYFFTSQQVWAKLPKNKSPKSNKCKSHHLRRSFFSPEGRDIYIWLCINFSLGNKNIQMLIIIFLIWTDHLVFYLNISLSYEYFCRSVNKINDILIKGFQTLRCFKFLLFAGKAGSDWKSVGQDLQNTDQHRLVLFTCLYLLVPKRQSQSHQDTSVL